MAATTSGDRGGGGLGQLKQNGWIRNFALGASYISLPWWASQALFGTLTPDIILLTLLYNIAGLGIAIVNDFKSIEGDMALGLQVQLTLLNYLLQACELADDELERDMELALQIALVFPSSGSIVEGLRQPFGSMLCGYYALRFMRHLMEDPLNSLKLTMKELKYITYGNDDIYEVQFESLELVQQYIIE